MMEHQLHPYGSTQRVSIFSLMPANKPMHPVEVRQLWIQYIGTESAIISLLNRYAPKDAHAEADWYERLKVAVNHPDVVARFTEVTGIEWDTTSGTFENFAGPKAEATKAFLTAFVPWFTYHVWASPTGGAA